MNNEITKEELQYINNACDIMVGLRQHYFNVLDGGKRRSRRNRIKSKRNKSNKRNK